MLSTRPLTIIERKGVAVFLREFDTEYKASHNITVLPLGVRCELNCIIHAPTKNTPTTISARTRQAVGFVVTHATLFGIDKHTVGMLIRFAGLRQPHGVKIIPRRMCIVDDAV